VSKGLGAVIVLLCLSMLGGAALVRTRFNVRSAPTFPAEVRAPDGQRVRVEVLNATKQRGLGRRATEALRDRGFDVVDVGTTSEAHDTTLVLDRSGHPDWAKRIAAALAPARVEARPDTSRYLDVTVLVGSAWRPPAQPFYP